MRCAVRELGGRPFMFDCVCTRKKWAHSVKRLLILSHRTVFQVPKPRTEANNQQTSIYLNYHNRPRTDNQEHTKTDIRHSDRLKQSVQPRD
jgi:hypothetical protein